MLKTGIFSQNIDCVDNFKLSEIFVKCHEFLNSESFASSVTHCEYACNIVKLSFSLQFIRNDFRAIGLVIQQGPRALPL